MPHPKRPLASRRTDAPNNPNMVTDEAITTAAARKGGGGPRGVAACVAMASILVMVCLLLAAAESNGSRLSSGGGKAHQWSDAGAPEKPLHPNSQAPVTVRDEERSAAEPSTQPKALLEPIVGKSTRGRIEHEEAPSMTISPQVHQQTAPPPHPPAPVGHPSPSIEHHAASEKAAVGAGGQVLLIPVAKALGESFVWVGGGVLAGGEEGRRTAEAGSNRRENGELIGPFASSFCTQNYKSRRSRNSEGHGVPSSRRQQQQQQQRYIAIRGAEGAPRQTTTKADADTMAASPPPPPPEEARVQLRLTAALLRAIRRIAIKYGVLPSSVDGGDGNAKEEKEKEKEVEESAERLSRFFSAAAASGKGQAGAQTEGEGSDDDGEECIFTTIDGLREGSFVASPTFAAPSADADSHNSPSPPPPPALWLNEVFAAIRSEIYAPTDATTNGGNSVLSQQQQIKQLLRPYASPECGVVLPPAHTAQCLVYALTTMTRGELRDLARAIAVGGEQQRGSLTLEGNPSTNNSTMPLIKPAYNVFSPAYSRIFSRSLCARAATCVQWLFGTMVPLFYPSAGDIGAAGTDAKATAKQREKAEAALLGHFGVDVFSGRKGGMRKEDDQRPTAALRSLMTHRARWLHSATVTDTTPLVPLHPLAVPFDDQEGQQGDDGSSLGKNEAANNDVPKSVRASAVIFDDRAERIKIVRSVADIEGLPLTSSSSRDRDGGNALPLLSAREVIEVLEAFAWRSAAVGGGIKVTHSSQAPSTTNPTPLSLSQPLLLFPSLVLFSGDSVLRSAFYDLVSAIRAPLKVISTTASSSSAPSTSNSQGEGGKSGGKKNSGGDVLRKLGGYSWGSGYDGKVMYIVIGSHDALLPNMAHYNPEAGAEVAANSFAWPPEATVEKPTAAAAAGDGGESSESEPNPAKRSRIVLEAGADYPFPDIPFSAVELREVFEPQFDVIAANPNAFSPADVLRLLRPVSGEAFRRPAFSSSSSSPQKSSENNAGTLRLRLRTLPVPWVLHQLKRVCVASTLSATEGRQRKERGHLCPRFITMFEFDNHAGNTYGTFMPTAFVRRMEASKRGEGVQPPSQIAPPSPTVAAAGVKEGGVAEAELGKKKGAPHPLPPTIVGAHIHSFGVWQHKENDVVSRTHAYLTTTLFPLLSAKISPESSLTDEGAVGSRLVCTNGEVRAGRVLQHTSAPPSAAASGPHTDDRICMAMMPHTTSGQQQQTSSYSSPPPTLFIGRITSGYKHMNARDNDRLRPATDEDDAGGQGKGGGGGGGNVAGCNSAAAPPPSYEGHYADALEAAIAAIFPHSQGTADAEAASGNAPPPPPPRCLTPLGTEVGGAAAYFGREVALTAALPNNITLRNDACIAVVPARYQPFSYGSAGSDGPPPSPIGPLPLRSKSSEEATLSSPNNNNSIGYAFDSPTAEEQLVAALLERSRLACLVGGTTPGGGGHVRRSKGKRGKGKPDRGSWEYIFARVQAPMAATARIQLLSKLAGEAFLFLAHAEGIADVWETHMPTAYKVGREGGENAKKKRRPPQSERFAELLSAFMNPTPRPQSPAALEGLITAGGSDQQKAQPSQHFSAFPAANRQRIDAALRHSEALLVALEAELLAAAKSASHPSPDAQPPASLSSPSSETVSASATAATASPYYVYDAMALQSLYPFASNDYLHFDCHFSVNSRKERWLRNEPRVSAPHAALLSKVHYGLFSAIEDDYYYPYDDDTTASVSSSVNAADNKCPSSSAASSAAWWDARPQRRPSGHAIPIHQPLCWSRHSSVGESGNGKGNGEKGSSHAGRRPHPPSEVSATAGLPHSSHLSALFYDRFLIDTLNTAGGCEEWVLGAGGALPDAVPDGIGSSGRSGKGLSSPYSFAPSSPECAVLLTHNYNQCRNSMGANELGLMLARMRRETP